MRHDPRPHLVGQMTQLLRVHAVCRGPTIDVVGQQTHVVTGEDGSAAVLVEPGDP